MRSTKRFISADETARTTIHSDRVSLTLTYQFVGSWETMSLHKMDHIEFLEPTIPWKKAILDFSQMSEMDTSGALLVDAFLNLLRKHNIEIVLSHLSKEIEQVLSLVNQFYKSPINPQIPEKNISAFLVNLGKKTESQFFEFTSLVSFLGQVICQFGTVFCNWKKFKVTAFFSHIEQVGLNALPIVSLLSFLIGVVLAYQGITQLARFGAEIFTVNLLAVGILREVGILMTAIIVAGRSGSAFTAQIGTMVLNEELAALKTMGVDPIIVLVLPRMVALLLVLPILALFADIVGLLGGAFMTYVFLDLSFAQFVSQFKSALAPSTFWVGMVKAPFFAFIIGLVGCYEGLCVRSSAQSVGLHTTKSVVKSIFLVIVLDAVFSIIFAQLNI